ncbi:Protein rot1 [Sparassis crispa]|uniref:Protein ROT1 n=1 Tax=Sparassis crispa TaxID=139825 RepID=A0A401GT08_9APHY|nr:Protein rot1 [Sparassis crispa]GBE85346.1 Protein rot1 [Sparassis crispa]
MFLTPLLALLLAVPALAQDIILDAGHNVTTLSGTWASGSGNVVTGPQFANPANQTFNYPSTTGVSYSFTDDGFYEIARYRFNGNGTQPTCIVGVINWCHGEYVLAPNGSILMTPFGDGFQQIQDPCGAVSKFIQSYNDTETYQSWSIYQDPALGYQLQLFQFDGTPMPQQSLVSTTPNMLPTQALRNVSSGSLTVQADLAVNAGDRIRALGPRSIGGLVSAVAAVGIASAIL